jgi:hypothetical protein
LPDVRRDRRRIAVTTLHDAWRPCKPGELASLTERLNRQQHRRQFLQVFSAFAVGAAATVGSGLIWSKLQEFEEYHFAGLACSEVEQLVMRRRLDQLSPEIRKQLHEHIEQCPHCGPAAREMGIGPEMLSLQKSSRSIAWISPI